MMLTVSLDSNKIPYLLIGLKIMSWYCTALFSKAFQQLPKSRYLFNATAGNTLCVKNTLFPGVTHISDLMMWLCHLCDFLLSIIFVFTDLFQLIKSLGKNLGPTGAINRSDGLPSVLFGGDPHRCINRPANQEKAEDANGGCMFWHICTFVSPLYATFLKGTNQPWGDVGLIEMQFLHLPSHLTLLVENPC